MSNPNPSIPSESDIAAAEEAANQALAALEELRKQREAAEQAATNKAALMAAFEAALSTGRFALVNGELIDAHASRGLTDDEKFILALARNGRLKVTELAGTKVVLDEALGSAQKSGSKDPDLTDDEKKVLKLMRGQNPRVRIGTLGGKEVVIDKLFSRQRAEQKRQEATAQTAQTTDPTPDPGAGDPQPNHTVTVRTTSAPSGPQPVVAGGPSHDPAPSGPRRRVARRTDFDPNPAAPSGAPSQAPGDPVPAGAGYSGGSPYGPPPTWWDPSTAEVDPTYPPTSTQSEPGPETGQKRGLWRTITGR